MNQFTKEHKICMNNIENDKRLHIVNYDITSFVEIDGEKYKLRHSSQFLCDTKVSCFMCFFNKARELINECVFYATNVLSNIDNAYITLSCNNYGVDIILISLFNNKGTLLSKKISKIKTLKMEKDVVLSFKIQLIQESHSNFNVLTMINKDIQ